MALLFRLGAGAAYLASYPAIHENLTQVQKLYIFLPETDAIATGIPPKTRSEQFWGADLHEFWLRLM
ncbi:MAG: hypothetical protein JGK24_12510 [Microcoleus sp. PH2017_29_MFU_D_A]|jgi:hypothetical protein|uniref:hypothetical protein n=1 Tax=unclassified Microcoleus TaxID=2642155 RepID=UPI001DE45060|nr:MULTISPECIES: hypothetical protein [unclassified Microcoleus]MCC3417721.1 hypothetical protein [Microcoleus sp. PH2017_07_MST_O_A]MCC3467139.1 hypothetical protein [Microcoleus sp. PH2017_06_SFM_O_A]MCC3490355.1 hypothetical protein [Microcoleus sp. PH2017_16_JOR_D_A]MCC3495062.1 hypothetical protein [Microcoleus sp. PH2017_15_JOR_U_A]MCC3504355.1 hypothetical protein [Microcoleus sp. PH2017_19_SFW_U_A]MCC3580910.1 hypothetical protein [Microcoleus sp. PH2017_32_RDM_D_A]TAE14042.1 MAG: hy